MSILATLRQYRLVSLHIAAYRFNPGVISTVVTVALLYVMISLGFWQLDRAAFKDTLQQKIMERKSLSASGLDELPAPIEDRRYLPVKFTGEYDGPHSFLLDNKTLKSNVGYHVFTPVKISDSKAVLVARGFVKMGRTREQLPAIAPPSGKIEFRGLLDLPPSRALVLADNVQQTERWPVVLQYVDLAELSQLLGYELYDMVLWSDKDEAGSLEYDLPVLNLNSAKNTGYAFQWFAMSLALFIIYVVVNTKRR
ncbi:MAG TPA: SURF1 family protein [Gammaproteobacteria bacterium]|nr:SURF1 family protein [Gammaproteobacteria bacterium]